MRGALVRDHLTRGCRTLIAGTLFSGPIRTRSTFSTEMGRSSILLTTIPCSSVMSSAVAIGRSRLGSLCGGGGRRFGRCIRAHGVGCVSMRIATDTRSETTVRRRIASCAGRLTATGNSCAAFVHSAKSRCPCISLCCAGGTFPSSMITHVSSTSVKRMCNPCCGTNSGAVGSFGILSGITTTSSMRFHRVRICARSTTGAGTLTSDVCATVGNKTSFATLTGGCKRANRSG